MYKTIVASVFICVMLLAVHASPRNSFNGTSQASFPQANEPKYTYKNKFFEAKISSVEKLGSTITLALKLKNLANDPFLFGLSGFSSNTSAWLIDDEGEKWQYQDNDGCLTCLNLHTRCEPGEWTKVHITFKKLTGTLDVKTVSFSCEGAAGFSKVNPAVSISIAKIPIGYKEARE